MFSLGSVWSCVQHSLRVHTTAPGSSPALVDSVKELGSFSNVVGGFRKQRVFIVEVLLSSERNAPVRYTRTCIIFLIYLWGGVGKWNCVTRQTGKVERIQKPQYSHS